MSKYRVIFDGEEAEELFDTFEEVDEYGLYLVPC